MQNKPTIRLPLHRSRRPIIVFDLVLFNILRAWQAGLPEDNCTVYCLGAIQVLRNARGGGCDPALRSVTGAWGV